MTSGSEYNARMLRFPLALLLAGACGLAFGADAPSVSKIFDGELSMIESELVPLAEAMPADKYDFAPTHGEFKGVRTFGRQVSHVAAVMYLVSASVLGEKVPAEAGEGENGPATLKVKDDYVKYLKGAIAYSHKAMKSLTDANLTGLVKSAFGNEQVPRVSMATVTVWHSFDHYGQMVVYARMNGVIPPASRR
jgi:DinB family